MQVVWYIPFTKIFLLNICIVYTYFKILNKKNNNVKDKIIMLVFTTIMALLYSKCKAYIQKPFIYL